ncbi:N-6 DNA methylase [Pseudomonas sp. CP4]|uniref:N-6 DNA methylase n=1 Tax=Pseudomonas sp. CP4 TaxID=3388844 RepID=UPI0039EF59A4
MLDATTKRRIDACRDILVGKVPDPKSQVEQITIALIYKFMDDMDAEAEELGGKRSFFVNGFEKYSWTKLLAPNMGGQDTLNLYSEAIGKMTENTHLPTLFRDIFKNAYLPYRDPETLRSFLKEIDVFDYDHSEKLGDAFEYLLSVLGSQGDAGQFRTPRHIIDFIVEVIKPLKHDRIIDPACGTAGFLISAWKHILETNQKDRPGDLLTPDERNKLSTNIRGYDISPDMVRLSLVNLYLHGFPNPQIDEYDTLTSEERWNEYADVILANPPFMSPKGGIKPHKRFTIQATRSEVLFVDYIAEHLSPNGRAGIIVPEGIIFQSGTAYKNLREMLVKKSLVAVISLPAGVFNPYSGVKTSILILDKRLAKKATKVVFVKIENDGFSLNAQRRASKKNDLPEAQRALDLFFSDPDNFEATELTHAVDRTILLANADCSFTGERYKEIVAIASSFPAIAIGDVVKTITPPAKLQKQDWSSTGRHPIIDQSQDDIAGWTDDERFLVHSQKNLVVFGDHTCAVKLVSPPFAQGADGIKIIETSDNLLPEFLYHFLKVYPLEVDGYKRHFGDLKRKIIPLPPISIQQEILAEINEYKVIVDGARRVVDNYQPRIDVKADWPIEQLSNVTFFQEGPGILAKDFHESGVPLIRLAGLGGEKVSLTGCNFLDPKLVEKKWSHFKLEIGDILILTSASFGRPTVVDEAAEGAIAYTGIIRFKSTTPRLETSFLKLFLASPNFLQQAASFASGAVIKHFGPTHLKQMTIVLPPVDAQKQIVAEVEAEQNLVRANAELISRFEKKIKLAVDRVWGS